MEKAKLKRDFMMKFVSTIDTISFVNASRFQGVFQNDVPNNAFFMAFDRYASMKDQMRTDMLTTFEGNLKRFIDFHRMAND